MRTNLWLSVLLVLVLFLNVTICLPLLSPSVFVSRYNSPASAKTQLTAPKIQIRPVSEKEGLVLAERMLNWVQGFVEKMATVKELSTGIGPRRPISPYPYNDDLIYQPKYHQHRQRQQQIKLEKEQRQRQLLKEQRQLEQQQRQDQMIRQIIAYPTSKQEIDLEETNDEEEREEEVTAEEIENPRDADIEKSAAPVSWRRSKRNPRCLHTCLKRGLLHPAQCHMLC